MSRDESQWLMTKSNKEWLHFQSSSSPWLSQFGLKRCFAVLFIEFCPNCFHVYLFFVHFTRFAVAFTESMKEMACLQWVCIYFVSLFWLCWWSCRVGKGRFMGTADFPSTLRVAATVVYYVSHLLMFFICIATLKTALIFFMWLLNSENSPIAQS